MLALIVLLLLAGASVLVVAVTGMSDRIPAGVRADDVDIGGMSPVDAERALKRHARLRETRAMLIIGPRQSVRTSGARLGARADVAAAIADAETGLGTSP